MAFISSDKQQWLDAFQQANAAFLEKLKTFREDQINTHPSPDSWSAGQVAEHIHKSDKGMQFLLAGADKKEKRPADEHVEGLKNTFLNFDVKLQSPDFIIPEDQEFDRETIIKRFEKERTAIEELIRTKALDETCMGFQFPRSGYLTRLEIIAFVTFHTQRHVKQLERIAMAID